MSKPRLIYFDAPVSRGEECRLALHLAGIDFEDVRIKSADWPAMKEQTPYGALPVLELPGKPALAQTNAILVLIGRRHGLHPADELEAATGSKWWTSSSTWPCAGSSAARSIMCPPRSSPGTPGSWACTRPCVIMPA
jgi:glutathione S-transferase